MATLIDVTSDDHGASIDAFGSVHVGAQETGLEEIFLAHAASRARLAQLASQLFRQLLEYDLPVRLSHIELLRTDHVSYFDLF